jgi:hypothetical protein
MRQTHPATMAIAWATASLAFVLGMSPPLSAAGEPPPSPAVTAPAIEPKAEAILRQWSDYVSDIAHFELAATDTMDTVLASGQKLQYAHRHKAIVSRPGRLKIESLGDELNRVLWLDGTQATVHDIQHNVYARTQAEGTLESVMDLLLDTYGVTMPMADLISNDPYAILTADVRRGDYMGEHHVDGTLCHHLAFRQQEIDWQMWIEVGQSPRLCRMVITFKQLPGQPQYTLEEIQMTPLKDVPASTFQFTAPKDAVEIELEPINNDSRDTPAPE